MNQQITPLIGISAIFNIIGHVVIICSIRKCRQLHTKCHLVLANLCLSDMIMGATLFPFLVTARGFDDSPYKCHILRTIAEMIEYTALNCTIMNLLLLTLDRYIACMHAFKYANISKRCVACILGVCWVMSALMSALCLIEQPANRTAPTIIRERMSSDAIHTTLVLGGAVFITVLQIRLCRLSTAYVSSAMKERRRLHGKMAELYDLTRSQRKAIAIVVAMTVAFAFCYIPMGILKVLRFLHYRTAPVLIAEKVSAALIPLNGAINPAVYGLSSRTLRTAVFHSASKLAQRFLQRKSTNRVSTINQPRRGAPTM